MSGGADSLLSRWVFALLVLASFAAFFVTQRLKHTPTVVQGIQRTPYFSPTAGGPHGVERISFRIRSSDDVTVTIVNSAGDDIATLKRDVPLKKYVRLRVLWYGYTDAGGRAPDGDYRIRVRLRRQGRAVLSPRTFRLDTTPPRPRVTSISPISGPAPATGPTVLPLPQGGGVKIAFTPDIGGNPNDTDGGRDPQLFLYRTDVSPARLVEQLPAAARATSTTWDGTVAGHAAPAGTYVVAIRARDAPGNTATDPAVLPPVAAHPPAGRAGITVRYLGVQPPSAPAIQHTATAFGVDARQQPYRWSIARVGASRPRAGATATKPILDVQAPGGVSGVYMLGVASGTHSAAVPFAVQDTIHQRVLVVLPTITWLGTDPVDEDGDGEPNTLTADLPVRRERIFAAAPPGFADEVAPVLTFLDRSHLRYDVTTDLALASSPQSLLAGHSGVLLPGDERWLTATLAQALRGYVSGGGTLASLGTDSLRGVVRLSGDQLVSPTPAGDVDALGARLGALSPVQGAITDFQDGPVQLFRGGDGRFTGYSQYEPVQSPGPGAQVVSSAVAAGGTPVIVAARLGRGLWIHTGLPGFAGRLGQDPDTTALMTRIWQLLAGR
jgi:hypothetical protein